MINKEDIKEYKNFLTRDELNQIEEKILSPNWSCNHRSNDHGALFWQMSGLENDEFYSVHLLNKIKEVTNDDFIVERIYFNGHNACGQGSPHKDSNSDNGKTFLIYCNSLWAPNLGGGTAFIDNDTDDVFQYYPYPRSAIYFRNNIDHFAMPVSKDFRGIRVTLAFKLFKK